MVRNYQRPAGSGAVPGAAKRPTANPAAPASSVGTSSHDTFSHDTSSIDIFSLYTSSVGVSPGVSAVNPTIQVARNSATPNSEADRWKNLQCKGCPDSRLCNPIQSWSDKRGSQRTPCDTAPHGGHGALKLSRSPVSKQCLVITLGFELGQLPAAGPTVLLNEPSHVDPAAPTAFATARPGTRPKAKNLAKNLVNNRRGGIRKRANAKADRAGTAEKMACKWLDPKLNLKFNLLENDMMDPDLYQHMAARIDQWQHKSRTRRQALFGTDLSFDTDLSFNPDSSFDTDLSFNTGSFVNTGLSFDTDLLFNTDLPTEKSVDKLADDLTNIDLE
ncbi:hypothetical protein QBC34DRAFT_420119 [Podospora aff. communis PSN243]|uniref:BZIP domain-containing protein n=1 Tax=Podospora aff. communis PSN243 TaxID=3040156 RepID=A0AAV9H5K7_9PEZI|nr:hypothetical protein QBC34DRAFT_420119 [Podospora aff. communis PSN243]